MKYGDLSHSELTISHWKDQEPLHGESISIKDQRHRKISDGLRDVVFDLFVETRFCI